MFTQVVISVLIVAIVTYISYLYQEGRGHWADFYTSTQSFKLSFSYLTTLRTFIKYRYVGSLNWVSNRSITSCNLQEGLFVNHYWEWTSINQPLSYPFRFLEKTSRLSWNNIFLLALLTDWRTDKRTYGHFELYCSFATKNSTIIYFQHLLNKTIIINFYIWLPSGYMFRRNTTNNYLRFS